MAYAVEIEQEKLGRPLIYSAIGHLLLFSLLLAQAFLHGRLGEAWGGGGTGAIQVTAVRSLPGIPLPRPEITTDSRRFSESKGLYESETRPREAETRAAEIPKFQESKPEIVRRGRSAVPKVERTPPPAGAIPYGEGGAPALPYTTFQVGGATEGGLAFGDGGYFGQRYPWYVDSVRRRISSNWLWSTIEPSVRWAPRAYVTFDVLRDGFIVNIQLLRSSGVASIDRSAVRAVMDSSPLDRLPNDYASSKVSVEFWFDFRR